MQEANPSPSPEWGFSTHWQVLPGMAHGSSQPVMIGLWKDGDHLPGDLSTVDSAMALLVAQDLPADLARCADAASVIRRVLFWAAAVQRQNQIPVFDPGWVLVDPGAASTGMTRVVVPYWATQASWAALQWSASQWRRLINQPAAAPADAFEPGASLAGLTRTLQPFRVPGYNTFRFLTAANTLDIPVRHVVDGVHAYGYGRYCHWLESSYTDQTPVIGTRIARDKFRCAQVLRACGLPAPSHQRVASVQHAVQVAQQLGYPVVVKPADRDQGQGVAADLRDDVAVAKAFRIARACSINVLVEKHAEGLDYRLTVVHGRLVKTVMRRPAGVIGDGQRTIADLVEAARTDAAAIRLRQDHGRAALELDAEALGLLSQHGMRADTVVAQGQFVSLRRRANASAGGTPVLITEPVHPDNQRLAERAAKALQLDVAGVDLIIGDIARSWLETGALICEVNAQPQIGDSVTPGIYAQVLRQLLPLRSRIPVVLLVGDGDADGAATALLRHGADRDAPWAMACSDGVWEGHDRICAAPCEPFAGARILSASRSVGAAIVVMSPAQILASGLPFDRVDLVVMTQPRGAGVWQQGELAAMWTMLVPAVTDAIAYPMRSMPKLPLAATLPDGVELLGYDGASERLRLVTERIAAIEAGG